MFPVTVFIDCDILSFLHLLAAFLFLKTEKKESRTGVFLDMFYVLFCPTQTKTSKLFAAPNERFVQYVDVPDIWQSRNHMVTVINHGNSTTLPLSHKGHLCQIWTAVHEILRSKGHPSLFRLPWPPFHCYWMFVPNVKEILEGISEMLPWPK